MKITNRMNLPEAVVRAVQADEKKREHYSVTGLNNPPKIYWLTRRHYDEIEVDAADRLWILRGKSMHYILQKSEGKNDLVEQKLSVEVNGEKVEGTADLLDEDRILSDYKDTSVWTIIYGSRKEDWEKQLNLYAYMYRQAGFEVGAVQVVAMLKDWKKAKAHEADYPDCPVAVVKLKLWTEYEQKRYLEARVKLMEWNRGSTDDEIEPCSPEERWNSGDTFAVMKVSVKTAKRVLDSEDDAKTWAADAEKNDKKLVGKLSIERRPGEDKRCADYCDCKNFCHFWKEKNNDK